MALSQPWSQIPKVLCSLYAHSTASETSTIFGRKVNILQAAREFAKTHPICYTTPKVQALKIDNLLECFIWHWDVKFLLTAVSILY